MFELYLARRLREELRLAEQADDLLERSIHLQACRYYRDLLRSPPHFDSADEVLRPVKRSPP